jgi:hypothetical protein
MGLLFCFRLRSGFPTPATFGLRACRDRYDQQLSAGRFSHKPLIDFLEVRQKANRTR